MQNLFTERAKNSIANTKAHAKPISQIAVAESPAPKSMQNLFTERAKNSIANASMTLLPLVFFIYSS
jgi:hypothetical protein